MTWTRLVGLLALVPFLILALAAKREPAVSVRVSPPLGMAGGTLKVTIRVPFREQNRLLEWVVDSAAWSSRSAATLGPDDPITRELRYDHLPAGRYYVAAFVTRSDASTERSDVVEACFSGGDVTC